MHPNVCVCWVHPHLPHLLGPCHLLILGFHPRCSPENEKMKTSANLSHPFIESSRGDILGDKGDIVEVLTKNMNLKKQFQPGNSRSTVALWPTHSRDAGRRVPTFVRDGPQKINGKMWEFFPSRGLVQFFKANSFSHILTSSSPGPGNNVQTKQSDTQVFRLI